MTVDIVMKETSQPVTIKNVRNTYTKGQLYCVYVGDHVYKYPLSNIHKVVEDFKKVKKS